MGLEVDLVGALAQEGVDVAKGLEAHVHLALALHEDALDRLLVDVAVDARLGAAGSAEELVDGDVEGLALDVPEGNVDEGDGGVDGQALEGAEAVYHVPMVLNVEGSLALEVLGKPLDARSGGLDVAPDACLAVSHDACLRDDAAEHELADM